MRIGFWIAVISFLGAAILSLRLKETLTGENIRGIKDVVNAYKVAMVESFGVWRLLPRSAFILFSVYSMSSFFIYMGYPFYLIYATDVLHIEAFQYAIALTLQSIAFFASVVPIGKLVDKVGRKGPLIASSFFFTLGMLLFIYADAPRLYAAYLLFALGNACMFTAYASLQADIVPKEHRGKATAFTNFTDLVLASTSAILGGIIYESISSQLPFMLSIIVMVPTVILTLLFIHEPRSFEICPTSSRSSREITITSQIEDNAKQVLKNPYCQNPLSYPYPSPHNIIFPFHRF